MKYVVVYRLLSMEFRGMKRRAMFNGAIMSHGDRTVRISELNTPPKKVGDYLTEIDGRELRTIRYQIIARNPTRLVSVYPPVTFCHPFPKGTGVRLYMNGDGSLALLRDGKRRFFSDNFTLAGVTDGRVDSTQPAYQFHE